VVRFLKIGCTSDERANKMIFNLRHKQFLILFPILFFFVWDGLEAQITRFNENPSVAQTNSDHIQYFRTGIFNEINGNPAWLSFSDMPDYGHFTVGSYHESGSFRQNQQPESFFYGAFSADGRRSISDWDLTGSVDLNRGKSFGLNYYNRAPRNNRNPYQWADTTGGDWINNIISLSGGAAKDIVEDRFAVGITGYYDVMQGARQNVERPLYNYSRYIVVAGITQRLTDNSLLGVHSIFGRSNEEQELGFFNQLDTNALIQRGIGTFNRNTFNSASRTYDGSMAGGEIQYRLERDRVDVTTTLGYLHTREDVVTGISNPVDTGSWRYHEIRATGKVARRTTSANHQLAFNADLRIGSGIDPLLEGENVYVNGLSMLMRYQISLHNRIRTFSLFVGFLDDETEDRVSRSLQHVQTIYGGVGYGTALWSERLMLDLNVTAGSNLQNRLDFSNENELISRLFIPDQEFWENSAITTGLDLLYVWERPSNRFGAGVRLYNTAGLLISGPEITSHRSVVSIYFSLFNK
jgi:hypothetical protein